jgi:hypothetical protein
MKYERVLSYLPCLKAALPASMREQIAERMNVPMSTTVTILNRIRHPEPGEEYGGTVTYSRHGYPDFMDQPRFTWTTHETGLRGWARQLLEQVDPRMVGIENEIAYKQLSMEDKLKAQDIIKALNHAQYLIRRAAA